MTYLDFLQGQLHYSPNPNPEFSLYINHVSTDTTTSVCNSFFSNCETMFQHVNPKFINPLLKQSESELLELDVSMEIEI